MIGRAEDVKTMLLNRKPIDQIVAESRWSRRHIEALAASQQLLIHPESGIAYNPTLATHPQPQVPAPRDAEPPSGVADTTPRAGEPVEERRKVRQPCVHDRLVTFGLAHKKVGIRRAAERVRRDCLLIAQAADADRTAADDAAERRRLRYTDTDTQRAAQRARAVNGTGATKAVATLMARVKDLADDNEVTVKDVRAWCFARGLCGLRGLIGEYALDEYERAHQ